MTPEERYLENENLIYSVLRKQFPSLVYDEDIQQEARIGLWQACLKKEDDDRSFSLFAWQCIRNSVLWALRERNKEKYHLSLSSPIESDECCEATLQDMIAEDYNLDWADYEGFMSILTPLERKICELRLLGFTQSYIAKKTNLGGDYEVRYYLKKARKKFDYVFCES